MLVLNQISVQLDWQLLSIVLPFGMIVVVVVLGEILFRRRRKRIASHDLELEGPEIQAPPIQVQPYESYDEDSEERRLERLEAEVEKISELYFSGQIGREEFSDRVHKVEDELLTLKPPRPPIEHARVRVPRVRGPRVEEPRVEEPRVEEPRVEEPRVEEPRVEEPRVEEPKMRRCIHCNQEIPLDGVYCDRCGRYLGASTS
jgi:hypothetical protein